MVGCQVRVPHGHREVGMTESALKDQDVSAIHHEVGCERMTKDVRELALPQLQARALDALAERRVRIVEQPSAGLSLVVMGTQTGFERRRDRDGPDAARFRFDELNLAVPHVTILEVLRLAPA